MAQRYIIGKVYGGFKSAVFKPRYFCTETTNCAGYEYDEEFPKLTKFQFVGRPDMLAPDFNFVQSYLVIQPRVDKSFSLNDFLGSSKIVVQEVSNRIAEGNFEAMKTLVTPDVLEEIQTNLPKFSDSQRQDLAINGEELIYSFLDQISLTEDEESGMRSLEILTIHHSHKGLENLGKLSTNDWLFGDTPKILENKVRRYISNYRFVRKYYPSGEADYWKINAVQYALVKSKLKL